MDINSINVTEDLFSKEWTVGSLTRISPIVKVIGFFSACIISIIGFGIIMSSIIKNSFAGLYAANPRLWDRVDEIKIGNQRLESANSNNKVAALLGTAMTFILGMLPNIKKMTDFDDGILDAKVYFLRAIPLMCLTVFIGVFIFRGYPSRVAEFATDFGTGVFDMVLDNVDPTAWVEAVPTEFAVLKFTTDNATDDYGKFINKQSKAVAKAYLSYVDDVSKKKRPQLALGIESWVESRSANQTSYMDSDAYKMTVSAMIYSVEPSAMKISRDGTEDSSGIIQFFNYTALNDSYFDSGSTRTDLGSTWIGYTVRYTPVAKTGTSKIVTCTLSVPNSSFKSSDSGAQLVIDLPSNAKISFNNGSGRGAGKVSGKDGTPVSVNITGINGTYTISCAAKDKSKVDWTSVKQISELQSVCYSINNKSHPITSITIGNSGLKLTTSSGDQFNLGEDPTGGQ